MILNKEQLRLILADLYAMDPNLRQRESELENIILQIAANRPEVEFSENFRQQLRDQLARKAVQFQPAAARKNFSWLPNFSGRFSYTMAGALALVIIVLSVGYFANQQGIISFNLKSAQNKTAPFNKIALNHDNAFGLLNNQSAPANLASGNGEQSASVSGNSANSSVGTLSIPAIAPVPDGRGGGGGNVGSKMILPYSVYKYVYKGESLDLKNSTVEVLRRVGFNQDASGLSGLLGAFGSGLIKINSFTSLKLQNINFVEDKDNGYSVSINAADGSIFISQNWLKWPQPLARCAGDARCIDDSRLKIADVLSDDQVIKIANSFVKAHGINISSYGQPQVTDVWRADYEKTEDKSQFYIPESANVLYPLMINNNYIYDESGNKTGLNISVNMSQKKVTDVGNLTSQSYEASNYAAETDAVKILKVVEQGGYWGYNYPMEKDSGANVLEIEVGTPSVQYVLMSNYNNSQTNYLLVPSLIFPIVKTPSDINYYYPKSIVVPLAKDLLDQRVQPPYVMQSSGGAAIDVAIPPVK